MPDILVIDDDPAIQLLLKRSLEKQGYSVQVATNGQDGIECARKTPPSLILCDWIMPGLDGLEVCRRIKADAAMAATGFILLTSKSGVENRVLGLDTGADDFLSKPIDLTELTARVRAILRLYQLTQELQEKKQRLEAELSEAADYVRSLLPKPIDRPLHVRSCYIPSSRLGGDCFDYYWLDPDYLALYLLDTAGHGFSAALLSISVLNLIRSHSLPGVNVYQPKEVLQALNETFQMEDQSDKYFTIWYGVYNRTTRRLIYASAGHPPAILITATDHGPEVQSLRTPGLPIGMLPDVRYTHDFCQIAPGSSLFLFSDGVYEIQQPTGETWTLEAFIELLRHHWANPAAAVADLPTKIRQINQRDLFDDDFSLLQLKLP